MTESKMSRRDLMGLTCAAAVTGMLPAQASAAPVEKTAGRTDTALALSHRMLGSMEVSSIGLGCLPMVGYYGGKYEKKDMIALIRHAYDLGVTFFDTAEVYGPHTSESWVGEALSPVRDKVKIATKFGFAVEENQPKVLNSRPEHIRRAVEGSLKRLRTDHIDLLYQHRVDPEVPVEDVAGLMGDLMREGKILHWGMSEAGARNIRKAHAVTPVTAVQSEYGIWWREPETKIFPTLAELGIGFVPYCPLCRAFPLGGVTAESRYPANDRRATLPQFAPEALKTNIAFADLVGEWSKKLGISRAQLTLGWVLSRGANIAPIPGTTNPKHLEDLLRSDHIYLPEEALRDFDAAFAKLKLVGHRADPRTESQIDKS